MAKVIMTITPEDGMSFEEVMSFQTENYIGIWDSAGEKFVIMRQSAIHFELRSLGGCYDTLQELDDDVFEYCAEHIEEVFDENSYSIDLD